MNDIDIDLDEVLDLEGKTRKQWLRVSKQMSIQSKLFFIINLLCILFQEKLIDAKKSKELVEKFIVELLEKANTL